MVILCIGDSCCLPRPGLPYISTWPSLLKKRFVQDDLVTLFKRSCTTKMLQEEGDYLEYYSPNKVIIQLGIVDCAPRYLKESRLLAKIVKRLPSKMQNLFWRYWKLTHKRSQKQAYVTPMELKNNLINYLDRCLKTGVESVILIKIPTPSNNIVSANPLISDSVKVYNLLYDQLEEEYSILKVVNPLSGSPDFYFEDGYHPNIRGNQEIFSSLEQIL